MASGLDNTLEAQLTSMVPLLQEEGEIGCLYSWNISIDQNKAIAAIFLSGMGKVC